MKTQATITSRTHARNLCKKFILAILLSVAIFNLTIYAQKAELVVQTGHTDSISSLAFSPDGKTVASGSYDKTIKLWNAASGQQLHTFSTKNFVDSVAFSPDGKTIASGGPNGELILWDAESGEKLHTLADGRTPYISSVAFSPDGKTIASGSWDKTIKLWDAATGLELRTLSGHTNEVNSVAFSPDGKTIASGGDKTIKLWDAATGQKLRTLSGHTSGVYSVAFSPNGKMLASGSADKTIKLWDAATGQELRTLSGHINWVTSVAFSPDGKTIASGSWDKTIKLWDAATGQELRTLSGHTSSILSVAFSPDGKTIASGSGVDKTIKLWDAATGQELRTLSRHTSSVLSVAFSPDGKTIASGSEDNTIKLWDAATGQKLRALSGHINWVTSVAFSPDGKTIASGSTDNTIKLWDAATGQELRTLSGHTFFVLSVAFSPDGKTIASRSADNTIKLWDAASGQILKSFPRDDPNTALQISAIVPAFYDSPNNHREPITSDGRFQIKIGDNGKLNLFDVKSGKLLASLIALDKDDWAVVTPDGLFDASPGARRLMHYIVELEPIALEQMKDVYYVPGLLQKVFKGDPLPNVELLSGKDLFPLAEYAPLQPNQKQLSVKLTNRGGGIGQIQVLVNGKEFVRDARPANFDSNEKTANLMINLTNAPFLIGKENKIEIVTRNEAGSLNSRGSSRGTEIVQLFDYGAKVETPNIYAIVGGISNYTGDNLKLNFAAKDAEEMAKAIEIGATKLLGDQSKVHIRLLTSNGKDSNVKFTSTDARISTATKDNFQKAFSDFKDATPNDVFIVYLAGHGVALNLNQNPNQAGGDTYLYLTQEATTTDKSVLAIENSRQAMAISSEELKDLMKQNKALKQVLILDTCASGQAAQSFVQKRDLPSDQIRAIERLKDNTGFYVLMGSAADAVSYEASQYGQGLLTYSLLQGMKGAKLRENQFADVSLLFDYAQTTVPQMAKNIGGIQQPRIITPDTSRSFDIGKFTGEEQKQINLSNPKPIFLTPTLFNPAANRDNLKLSKMMAEQLRTLSYISARGANSSIVYVETDEMVDGIQPSGSYTVEGDTLKISVILVKNNQPVGKEIVVTGKTSEPDKAIRQLVESVMKSMS